MKKTIRCGIAAAVLVAAGFTAYQSYSSYGVQDNSLLMQNVEALAQSSDGGDGDSGLGSVKDQGRYIQTSRGFMVTNITGNVKLAANLGLSIGKLLKGGVAEAAANAGITITGHDVDTYKESCFYKKGANCPCAPTDDFIPCASQGCPKSCGE